MYRLLVLTAFLGGACKTKGDHQAPTATAAASPCATAVAHGPIAWIEDDYPAALACAKQRNVPLVVDLWAPWCHTCLSMKSTVLRDPSFTATAARFVFAALDTDREENAAAVARLPLSAWPTFYVLGTDEGVLARFVGAASVAQFHAFLEAGERARAGAEGADKHLVTAERAIAAGDVATAETELSAAITLAPPDWVRRPDALVSLINTKRKRGDLAGCMAVADAHMDATGTSASATDFVGLALACASASAEADPAGAARLRERAITRLSQLLAAPDAQLSVDDRSDAMAYLRGVLDEAGRKPEAIQLAEQQRQLLDDAAAKASTPADAMTYNWQRAEVHVYLGRPLEIVPALEASAKALPGAYDPPARLGWIYLQAGKLAEAATWTERALALAYGPRKARLLAQRAEIAARQGDVAAERQARAAAVALWESLPAGQANPAALAQARRALAALDAPKVESAPAVP